MHAIEVKEVKCEAQEMKLEPNDSTVRTGEVGILVLLKIYRQTTSYPR